MFEKIKHHHEEAVAAKARSATEATINEIEQLLAILKSGGVAASDVTSIMLKPKERWIGGITNVQLIEMRRGSGHWEGRSSGVSIPIGKIAGQSIRYRVGATKGHYEPGPDEMKVTDAGVLHVTTTRFIFQGSKKLVECQFAKLVTVNVSPGLMSVGVSNRQNMTTMHFDKADTDSLQGRIQVALAFAHDDVDELIASYERQIAELRSLLTEPDQANDETRAPSP